MFFIVISFLVILKQIHEKHKVREKFILSTYTNLYDAFRAPVNSLRHSRSCEDLYLKFETKASRT